MILAGDTTKTTVYKVVFWWDSEGDLRDMKLSGVVSAWIHQNEKVLNKRRSNEVLKLLIEQFPWLKAVDIQHSQLRWARYVA